MYTKDWRVLRQEALDHMKHAEAIAAKADHLGHLPEADAAEAQRHIDEGRRKARTAVRFKADADTRDMLRGLGDDAPHPPHGAANTGYRAGASTWATRVAGQLAKTAGAYGVKAITTGGIDVPAVVEPTVEIPSRPTRLLDLVPTRPLTGNSYSYPRQTARTSNAATVPDNTVKPESVYTFEEIEDRARVVAHTSEPIPLRLFEDHADLESVLDSQMRDDLLVKVEGLISNGNGTGEDWIGILGTSGVLAQAWTTNLITTLRKARTALENLGEVPTAWVFNPTDVEALDLLTDLQGRFYGPELDNLLGRLPRVPSAAVPAGTALLGDFRQARLFVRQDAVLAVDQGGDLFTRNQCRLRHEGRYGFGVLRPQAFVSVDLTP